MRILQFNTFDVWGGSEKAALILHQAYLKKNHSAFLAVKESFLENEKNVIELKQFSPHNSHKAVSLPSTFREKRGPTIAKKYRKFIRSFLLHIPRWPGIRHGCSGLASFPSRKVALQNSYSSKFPNQIQGLIRGYTRKKYNTSETKEPYDPHKKNYHRGHYVLDLFQGRDHFPYPQASQLLSYLEENSGLDIIQTHNLHGNYFDLSVLPLWSWKKPLFLTLHDEWHLTGHCACTLRCNRWEIGCGSCPFLQTYPPLIFDGTSGNWKIKQEIYKKSRIYLISPSRWLINRAEHSMLAPGIKESQVIPNGIDLSVFRPVDKKKAFASLRSYFRCSHSIPRDLSLTISSLLHGENPIILFIARGISFHKGETKNQKTGFKDSAFLLMAVQEVAKTIPNLVCILLGTGEKEPDLKCLFSGSKITHSQGRCLLSVPFEGNPENIALFYQAADIYLHASKGDNYPFVIAEASSCGAAVIAVKEGGISELIEHEETGLLIEKGDCDGMIKAIIRLLKNSSQKQQIISRSLRYSRKTHGQEKMIDNYLRFYERALSLMG